MASGTCRTIVDRWHHESIFIVLPKLQSLKIISVFIWFMVHARIEGIKYYLWIDCFVLVSAENFHLEMTGMQSHTPRGYSTSSWKLHHITMVQTVPISKTGNLAMDCTLRWGLINRNVCLKVLQSNTASAEYFAVLWCCTADQTGDPAGLQRYHRLQVPWCKTRLGVHTVQSWIHGSACDKCADHCA